MAKRRRSRSRRTRHKPGAPPGTLAAPAEALETRVRTMLYDRGSLREAEGLGAVDVWRAARQERAAARASETGGQEGESAAAAVPPRAGRKGSRSPRAERASLESDGPVLWVDVVGLAGVEQIAEIGALFDLHALALEDVLNVHQRPKAESYDTSLYVVARMIHRVQDQVESEQVSLFVGDGFVVTFQEHTGDSFEPVRERLRNGRGRLRGADAGYLIYALIDSILDAMFPMVEEIGDQLEELESRIFTDPSPSIVEEVHALKRKLVVMRRAVWPLRDALGTMYRLEHAFIGDAHQLFLRDCLDHVLQLVDLVEGQRELAMGLLDGYLSAVGYRQNEVMKVLTMMASIFIPLGFLAGLYGMNFDQEASPYNLPELSQPYGYPVLLGVMLTLAVGMVLFFRRRGWL